MRTVCQVFSGPSDRILYFSSTNPLNNLLLRERKGVDRPLHREHTFAVRILLPPSFLLPFLSPSPSPAPVLAPALAPALVLVKNEGKM